MSSSEVQAIVFSSPGPAASVLQLKTLPLPTPGDHDILVRLRANSSNPVDTKIRSGAFQASEVTGFDGAGVVEGLGSSVSAFNKGDQVYFSGALGRAGTNATHVLVDWRLVALKPKNLDWSAAAAVPLVSLTAWEMLSEKLGLRVSEKETNAKKSILIINGAGGVGSIATQLASRVFGLGKVIVTASRSETVEWAKKMGASHTISHREELGPQLKDKVGVDGVDYVFICHSTGTYLPVAVELANPGARIGSIVEVSEKLPGLHEQAAFFKGLSFSWELMFTKAAFGWEMGSQGRILKEVASLYDEGVLTTLVGDEMKQVLSVKGLVEAHEKLEHGGAIGKIVFEVPERLE